MMYSGAPSRIRAVALLLDKTLASAVTTWHPISDRLLYARLKHKHGHLSVVVACAPTDLSPDADKDIFYQQLESVTSSFPPHDKAVVLGDFNAVSGFDRRGFEEDAIGNYGSGDVNDNSTRLLSYCCDHRLVITGSWFQRTNIHRYTWLCNDQRTKKEIDHILTNDRSMFKSVRVYRGAESPANSDHRMFAADIFIFLNTYRAPRRPARIRLDFTLLAQDSELADKYNVTISNAFHLFTIPSVHKVVSIMTMTFAS